MILFPNAKINLGLRILRRRPDGYHDIASVMIPIGWCDILEILPAADAAGSFRQNGLTLDCDPQKNLVLKALSCLQEYTSTTLPPLDITLEKHIPFGAGMGGGSADAAFALIGANTVFNLGLTDRDLAAVAARVGADCPFFIHNRPMLATGIGEVLTPVDCHGLNGKYLLVVKPDAEAVSTAAAYAGVQPDDSATPEDLARAIAGDCDSWSSSAVMTNDFEKSIFPLRPTIALLKQRLLELGAFYSAMSGSGAAVFGIFDGAKMAEDAAAHFSGSPHWLQKLDFAD